MIEKTILTGPVFTSRTDEWTTPLWLFEILDAEFQFELDAAATHENAKCLRYYIRADDGLSKPWAPFTTWLNPPYGRVIGKWLSKAVREASQGATVVALVPARTDTNWWWTYALQATEIRFLRGRLRFGGGTGVATFPSVVLVFRAGLPSEKSRIIFWKIP